MSDNFKIQIKNQLAAQKIADVPGLLVQLMRVLHQENVLTVSYISEHYENFPSDGPTTMDGLRNISDRLSAGNTAAAPELVGGNITSSIGNQVEYAAIQEFGGQTRAHDIVARNAKALAFTPGGKFFTASDFAAALRGTRGNARKVKSDLFIQENGIIFRRVVHHPGSDIPARQPIQRGIEDRLPVYAASLENAISKFLN